MFVYFIKAKDLNVYKIGRASSPSARLKTIQACSPIEVTLLHTIHSANSIELEKKIHQIFSKFRLHGEWFEIPADNETLLVLMSADNLRTETKNNYNIFRNEQKISLFTKIKLLEKQCAEYNLKHNISQGNTPLVKRFDVFQEQLPNYSRVMIRENVVTGKRLSNKLANKINQHIIADNRTQLIKLSKFSEQEQLIIIDKMIDENLYNIDQINYEEIKKLAGKYGN